MKAFVLAVAMVVPAVAVAVTPVNGGTVTGSTVTINSSPGDQNDPHVSGDWAAYTDSFNNVSRIRYYNFVSGIDMEIPAGVDDNDLLSDVNGSRIAFSRVTTDRTAVMVFDASTWSMTEIAPAPGTSRFGTSLGGNTVAFVDLNSGSGDIFVTDLPQPAPLFNVSASPQVDENPALAPSGNAVVWEQTNALTSRDIMKSVRVGGVWMTAEVVANTTAAENNPDTDGTYVVYDSNRAGSLTGHDIYFQTLSGPGPESQLEIAGVQQNASISSGVIAFESTGTALGAKSDLYVYVIASNRLYQITSTPDVGEHLNDVTVLCDGSVRVVWAADEDVTATNHDILASTFELVGGGVVAPGCGGGGGGAGGGGGSGGGTGGGGGSGGGTGGSGGGSGGSGGGGHQGKVTICHIPPGNPNNKHTIQVGWSALWAHLNHGDYIGTCNTGRGGHDDDDDADDDDDDCDRDHRGNGHGHHHDDDDDDDDDHGKGKHHLDADPAPQAGCSATGGLAPMLLALIALAWLTRRPVPIRVRRK